jgi:hypothetical protein
MRARTRGGVGVGVRYLERLTEVAAVLEQSTTAMADGGMAALSPTQQIAVSVSVSPAVPKQLSSDSTHIASIVNNALSNALKVCVAFV